MQIKLIQSIRANGQQHRPPAVVDTKAIGISDAEVDVLVRSGVAMIVAEAAEAPEAEAPAAEPEVIVPETVAEATEAAEPEPTPEPAPAKPAKKR